MSNATACRARFFGGHEGNLDEGILQMTIQILNRHPVLQNLYTVPKAAPLVPGTDLALPSPGSLVTHIRSHSIWKKGPSLRTVVLAKEELSDHFTIVLTRSVGQLLVFGLFDFRNRQSLDGFLYAVGMMVYSRHDAFVFTAPGPPKRKLK